MRRKCRSSNTVLACGALLMTDHTRCGSIYMNATTIIFYGLDRPLPLFLPVRRPRLLTYERGKYVRSRSEAFAGSGEPQTRWGDRFRSPLDPVTKRPVPFIPCSHGRTVRRTVLPCEHFVSDFCAVREIQHVGFLGHKVGPDAGPDMSFTCFTCKQALTAWSGVRSDFVSDSQLSIKS
jgi:hypothetical protein